VLGRIAREHSVQRRLVRAGQCLGIAALALIAGSRSLQTAIAEGDTRSISFHHTHTGEDITITYKRNGRYDDAALRKLDWFMRDWRKNEQVDMDPHLFDLLWDTNREAGGNEAIQIICGYRSPDTNSMLRARSSGVAQYSLHTKGDAVDFYIPNVPLEKIREVGLRMQRGGVGFYPTSGSPFVHLDTGSIRHWPRMSRQQLVKVFPDGRTVHIPADGHPLPGYALALADVERRGNAPSSVSLAAARDAGMIGAREEQLAEGTDRPQQRSQLANFIFGSRAEMANQALPPPAPVRTPIVAAGLSTPIQIATTPIVPLPKGRPAVAVASLAPMHMPIPTPRPALPVEIASADPFVTASAGQALAYAAESPVAPAARAKPMGARLPKLAPAVAVEPLPSPDAPTMLTAVQPGYRFDNPWLRAAMLTPSVSEYLTVMRVGHVDTRQLRDFMRKPSSVVMMTFSADPNDGLRTDSFTGHAVVFLATLNSTVRTASLAQ